MDDAQCSDTTLNTQASCLCWEVMTQAETRVSPDIGENKRETWTLILVAQTVRLFNATQSAAQVIDVDMKPSRSTQTMTVRDKKMT